MIKGLKATNVKTHVEYLTCQTEILWWCGGGKIDHGKTVKIKFQMKMTSPRALLVDWKWRHDNMQFWWQMSAHCRSAATWDSFGHSQCILNTFDLVFTERTTKSTFSTYNNTWFPVICVELVRFTSEWIVHCSIPGFSFQQWPVLHGQDSGVWSTVHYRSQWMWNQRGKLRGSYQITPWQVTGMVAKLLFFVFLIFFFFGCNLCNPTST